MIKYQNSISKNIQNIGLFIALAFATSSCQTYALYNFQSLTAPDVIIPADVKSIGFVDRNISFPLDTISQLFTLDERVLNDTTDYSDEIAKNCYVGFAENLSEDVLIDTIQFIQLDEKLLMGERNYSVLSWVAVDSICEKTGSDILVCLEDIQMFTKYSIYNDQGYYGTTDIKHFSVWRIYDPLYQNIIDEKLTLDSLFTESFSNSYNALVEKELPSRREIFQDVSYKIGSKYGQQLSPVWNDITRKYFISGDARLAAARYYIDLDDWEKAINLWKELAVEEDLKLAGRACYNLALASEIKEEFNIANSWIRKSIASYKKMKTLPSEFKEVEKYTMQLVLRTQNKIRLNKFLGE